MEDTHPEYGGIGTSHALQIPDRMISITPIKDTSDREIVITVVKNIMGNRKEIDKNG